jgi:hypothetical protein
LGACSANSGLATFDVAVGSKRPILARHSWALEALILTE